MDEVAENNTAVAEVAPQADSAQSNDAGTGDTGANAPDVTPSDKEELILGKFKSQEDLVKSYQELESYTGRINQGLNDPNFIYQQARKLGLTAEEAQDAVEQAQGTSPAPAATVPDIQAQFRYFSSMEKAKEKYPDLEKDDELGTMVTALLNKGMDPLKAADKVMSRLNQVKETGKAEGMSEAKATISEKERATTAPVAGAPSSGSSELEDIQKRMKSYDSKTQEKAFVEYENYKARQRAK